MNAPQAMVVVIKCVPTLSALSTVAVTMAFLSILTEQHVMVSPIQRIGHNNTKHRIGLCYN